jgi:hypothetical protein
LIVDFASLLTLATQLEIPSLPEGLISADHLEVAVDEDVVRPAHAYVVDLIDSAADLHDAVDDPARICAWCRSGRFVRGRPAGNRARAFGVVRGDLPGLLGLALSATLDVTILELAVPFSMLAGSTITCVAVIVVLSVVPSTRTVEPLVTALAETLLVPSSYLVDPANLTVTFWPPFVESVTGRSTTCGSVPRRACRAGSRRIAAAAGLEGSQCPEVPPRLWSAAAWPPPPLPPLSAWPSPADAMRVALGM